MSYNFKEVEESALELWQKNNIYQKAKEARQGQKKYYFLDGPPYTSGRVHIGTAWNKSLKDMVLRYKRMAGFDVWDRAGYDMHGLPTENATQKKLNLKDKQDIESFGVKKFIEECKTLCVDNMKIMNKDFDRLGVWMDFENAYQSITDEFIDGEWWLIKRAHEENRLYQGYRSIAWDWHDETACAKHELEYQSVTDKSIYVKLHMDGNEYLIIWTTTPWTIPMNLGVMVHPEIEYAKCKVNHEGNDEVWIVAKDLAETFIDGICKLKFDIIETVMGAALEGKAYKHPLHEHLKDHYEKIKADHPNTHTVVLSDEYVTTESGTGLVHMAPGCGPEDYEVGHRNNIPAWNLLLTNGVFPDNMGPLAGMHAKHDTDKFIEMIENENALIVAKEYTHDYPFAQRSKQPVIFRATKQWFLKVEDKKPQMIDENNNITWVPNAAFNAFDSWLKNLRDNSISKQRFWGTPLPVWINKDNEEDFIVVGSKEELEELSGQKVEDMHIPVIDTITINKDGKEYVRVPDVLDVWVDAGTASWNCLDYPKEKDHFNNLFPAEFILEGKDQIRGWFNLLHVASMVSMDRPSFKNVYMHGFVNDAQGRKMSKSLGNYILPEEVISKYGADTLRFYTIGGANPGMDLNYNFDDMNLKYRNLIVLWNLHKFTMDSATSNPKNISYDEVKDVVEIEEQFILSKLNSTIKRATQKMDAYELNEVPWIVENFFLSVSRDYIQMVRDKAATGSEEEKKAVLYTLYTCMSETLKLLAPIAPFITEGMYQNFKDRFDLEEESVHLLSWPEVDQSKVNTDLEENMDISASIIQSILNAREKAKMGVRWPIGQVVVETNDENVKTAIDQLAGIIKRQTNVKELLTTNEFDKAEVSLEINHREAGKEFAEKLPGVVQKLAETPAKDVLNAISSDGAFKFHMAGEDMKIEARHVKVERSVSEPFYFSDSKKAVVYLDSSLTEELEAEGYAREVTRRVQNARKKAGLSKEHEITLTITSEADLIQMLQAHSDSLKEKVGAKALHLTQNPPEKFDHESKEKVKDKEFSVYF